MHWNSVWQKIRSIKSIDPFIWSLHSSSGQFCPRRFHILFFSSVAQHNYFLLRTRSIWIGFSGLHKAKLLSKHLDWFEWTVRYLHVQVVGLCHHLIILKLDFRTNYFITLTSSWFQYSWVKKDTSWRFTTWQHWRRTNCSCMLILIWIRWQSTYLIAPQLLSRDYATLLKYFGADRTHHHEVLLHFFNLNQS